MQAELQYDRKTVEEIFVGCCILDPDSVPFDVYSEELTDLVCSTLLEAIFGIKTYGVDGVDLISIMQELKDMGKLDRIVSVKDILRIVNKTPLNTNIDYYVKIIKSGRN